LRQLDPIELLTLRSVGSCQVTVPEWLYDRDYPGHYLRRIKIVVVSVSRDGVAEAQVFCTLSLIRSSIRKTAILKGGEYLRQGAEDDRFVDYMGAIQSIVTSSRTRDNGMFETDLHEARFLPFEGSGAVRTWQLDIPEDFQPSTSRPFPMSCCTFVSRPGKASLRQMSSLRSRICFNNR
jgi:hypothetical protein